MKSITAEILAIGDELLLGQTLDTNSHWLSAKLTETGIRVIRRTAVGDNEADILQAFAQAEARADVVLITGGLGPTHDDLTKPCLAKYFNCEIKIHPEALAEITAFFQKRGRELTETNRQQAALPVCCEKITNTIGTAPGMWFQRNGKVFVSMPGVPHEMKKMTEEIVLPKLRTIFNPPVIVHRIIRTAGIGESFLADRIAGWEKQLPAHIRLAYLPGIGEVKLRLTATGTDKDTLHLELEKQTGLLLPLIDEFVYATEDEPLEKVIGKMLRDKNLTLAIAESCTGGYISHLITSVPGSSDYFVGAMIPYAYEVKMRQLGVKPETLEKYGAVSEPTITEMASIVRAKFNAHIGVATSGIAGPGGATPEKPVGLIWIAYSDKYKTVTRKLMLTHDRLLNIKLTATAVLNLIRLNLPR
ncbi:MAG: CinA-like protein [Cyclobacteriaceae bacterium]|nr:MAG: CinA-like protein [Cyclobacteriaceae bacterium]